MASSSRPSVAVPDGVATVLLRPFFLGGIGTKIAQYLVNNVGIDGQEER